MRGRILVFFNGARISHTISYPTGSFLQWGFWEGAHWKPDAAMYRKDWTPKPSLAVWKELILDQWKTRVDSRADAAGQLAAHGHRGRYQATASAGGKTGKADFTLGADGAQAVITLK